METLTDEYVCQLAGPTSFDAVVDVAVRLAASLAGPPPNGRATYMTVRGDIATTVAQYDPAGTVVPPFIWLTEHKTLAEVVRTGKPFGLGVESAVLTPSLRGAVERLGVTDGAAVPVFAWGRLHGILAVGSRNGPIREPGRLHALARALERSIRVSDRTLERGVQGPEDARRRLTQTTG